MNKIYKSFILSLVLCLSTTFVFGESAFSAQSAPGKQTSLQGMQLAYRGGGHHGGWHRGGGWRHSGWHRGWHRGGWRHYGWHHRGWRRGYCRSFIVYRHSCRNVRYHPRCGVFPVRVVRCWR